ncbi:MAG: hypothetical protein FWE06_01600 [Oscillospiraceae bacterium]|nr:hypothetical protein [Oscillospiraceae bacterium]
MSEKKIMSISNKDLKEMKSKPKIEDVISECFGGEMKEIALDFVDYLRTNKMSPTVISITSWKSSCKGKVICYVNFDKGKLLIIPHLNHLNTYRETAEKEELGSVLQNNLFRCEDCNYCMKKYPDCEPGRTITILGKQFNNICNGRAPVGIYNPCEEDVVHIKRLLDLEKNARKESKSQSIYFANYNDS